MQYAGKPVRSRSFYNGSCPICHEGKSWGKKKRLFFFPDTNYLYCHKCARSWTPYFWVKEVTGYDFTQIKEDLKDYLGDDEYAEVEIFKKEERDFVLPDLPGECVNLLDDVQRHYYKNNPIVKKAYDYCQSRRLFTALNRPKTFYVCIEDKHHKNRLIVPFFDEKGRIVTYVSRTLFDTDEKAKYIVKFNSDKPLYNFHRIDPNYPYIFVIEGPIDSMFLKNAVSITGIHMTDKQARQINNMYPFHELIWIYDNPKFESEVVRKKIKDKLKNEERVFLYDGELAEYKDLNLFCTQKNLDFVDPDLIVTGSYKGNMGLLKL